MRSGLITHADKVLFPEHGETKGDLADHYVRVAGPLLEVMGGRSCCSGSPRARAGRRSFRSGCRPAPRTG